MARGGTLPLRPTAVLCLAAVLGAGSAGGIACRRTPLPPRPDGASVVVSAEPAADDGLPLTDEIEPNDLLANAQPITFATAPAIAVAGHLRSPPGSRAKDVDLFRITVPPPAVVIAGPDGAAPSTRQTFAITVQPDSGTVIAVDALDDQGKILVSSAGVAPGELEGIPNLAVTPGTYFVRVKPGPTPGRPASSHGAGGASGTAKDAGALAPDSYRLVIRLLPVEAGDEAEPNGKSTLAGDVAAGEDVAGFLGWRHDEDWFRLPLAGLPEGSVLSADLDVPPGVAASIAIYDSVEHKMVEQRGRVGDRLAVRNVRLPSSEPNMFVVVRAESGRNLDARYMLRLRTEEAKTDTELEPNDDPAHAVPLVEGTVLGYLGPGDVDVYRYTAPMPVELDFEVAPPERVDVKVELIREDGTVLTKIDAGKRREPERLPNLYVAGSVLLRLSAGKGDGNLDEPYRITSSSRPVEPGAEREPNGTAALATPLALGAVGTGLCFPRGDVDMWLVQGGAPALGGPLGVSVRGIAGLTLDVRVQTTQGKELGRFHVGGDASAPTHVNPGTESCCLIQVREATGRGANPRDRYSLSVAP